MSALANCFVLWGFKHSYCKTINSNFLGHISQPHHWLVSYNNMLHCSLFLTIVIMPVQWIQCLLYCLKVYKIQHCKDPLNSSISQDYQMKPGTEYPLQHAPYSMTMTNINIAGELNVSEMNWNISKHHNTDLLSWSYLSDKRTNRNADKDHSQEGNRG